jgi:Ca-activated chloride channel homolog
VRAAPALLAALAVAVAARAPAAAGEAPAAVDPASQGRAPSPCRVTITEPLANGLLYGMSDVAAGIRCPEGEAPASVTFLVDGKVRGVVTRPPWRSSWDAGGTFAAQLVEARLVDRTGRMSTDRVLTAGALLAETVRVTATPLDRVELSVSVVDAEGVPITGLGSGDFEVREAGRPQSPVEARPEDRPLSVALLVDVSGSMHEFWPRLKRTVPLLAQRLRPEDEVKLVAFSGPAYLVQDYTRDPARVRRSMERFSEWGGGTSLYDTIAAVGTEMAWGRAGRQVVVLVTDGIDTLSRLDPSRLRGYLRRTDVTVESLVLTGRFEDRNRLPKALNVLKQMARETGGDIRLIPDPGAIGAAFADLARNLENRYCVAWTSDLASREGWRSLEVSVRRPGATVRTRAGRVGARPIGSFLIDDLHARGRETRRKAADWLGSLRVEGGADALLGALGDHAPEVRAAAAISLGRLRETRAIDPLVTMLSTGDLAERSAAAEGLRVIGPPVVPALLDALGRAGPRRQIEILPVLADIGDARALEAIDRLSQPAPPPAWTPAGAPAVPTPQERAERAQVRIAALATLGAMESPAVLPTLVKGARDPDPAVRGAALGALQNVGTPEALTALEDLGDRAALLDGLAALTRRGRLGECLTRPEAAALFLRAADPGTLPTPDGPPPRADLAAAVGGMMAAADLLDRAARVLPHQMAFRAQFLAAAARGQAADGAAR